MKNVLSNSVYYMNSYYQVKMVDIKASFSNMEKRIINNFKLLNEKSVENEYRDVINECDKSIDAIKTQLKLCFVPINVKRTIQIILKNIFTLKEKTKRLLHAKQGTKVHDDFEFVEIESVFKSRLKTALVINLSFIDMKKTIINYINAALEDHKFLKVSAVLYGEFALKEREEEKSFNTKN